MKRSILIFLIFCIPAAAYCATGVVNSSYSYDYSSPPEFQPSLRSQFTSLASGVTDVNANPAGIMKVGTLELALGASGYVSNPIKSDENVVNVDDIQMKGTEGSPNSRSFIAISDDRSIVTHEPRPITINEDYSKGGGINYFGATYRMADWLAVSISRRRPSALSFNYQVIAPVLLMAQTNFRNMTFEAGDPGDYIRIRQDGTIEVVIAGAAMGTSEISAWSGFLEQGTSEVNWMNATFDNSLVNHNSITITTAIKTGPVSWGLNIMPETVDMELNNEMYVKSDDSNGDISFYIPRLNFASSLDALSWVTYEAGQASGYKSISIETLAGQELASAKVAGKYSGSVMRMDLGMQWDPFDFMSIGAVYENFNGATLKLEGVNVTQYVMHRIDRTSRMPTGEGDTSWDPFLPVATHEVETEESIRNILTMQPIELPRKLKFGVAFKKPFLIALDYEQWQNEYKFTSDPSHPELAHYITLKDITFLKMGMETQVFFLPMIMRGSLTGLLKPTSTDPDTEKNIDDAYANFPIMPVDGNIFFGFGVADGELGFGFGGGGLPLIKAVMFDLSSIAKVFYFSTYYQRGDWQINYLMTMDPILTGFNSDISTTGGEDSQIRLMSTQTFSIGFRF